MKGGTGVKLSKRQEAIAHIVREKGPVTGSAIAEHFGCDTICIAFGFSRAHYDWRSRSKA